VKTNCPRCNGIVEFDSPETTGPIALYCLSCTNQFQANSSDVFGELSEESSNAPKRGRGKYWGAFLWGMIVGLVLGGFSIFVILTLLDGKPHLITTNWVPKTADVAPQSKPDQPESAAVPIEQEERPTAQERANRRWCPSAKVIQANAGGGMLMRGLVGQEPKYVDGPFLDESFYIQITSSKARIYADGDSFSGWLYPNGMHEYISTDGAVRRVRCYRIY
jgi:hypothetical protein